ncbi:MAG: AAA family ATPase [Bacteroidetes bacterium]|nr:MAG: AAA family ATPase [Bacteroidota bacterium]
MDREPIFVGGIHGVGKTTVCKKLVEQLNVPHYGCSQLIKQYKQELESETTKVVRDVSANQNDLIISLERNVSEQRFLLDGHFCLFTQEDSIEEVPLDTFKQIKPAIIVLIIGDPVAIVKRISKRDGIVHNVERFIELQEKEREHAYRVADAIQIECVEYKVEDSIENLTFFLNAVLSTKG